MGYFIRYNQNKPHVLDDRGLIKIERVQAVIDEVERSTGHNGEVAIVGVSDHEGHLGLYILSEKSPEQVCRDKVIQSYFAAWLSVGEYEATIFYIGHRAKAVNVTLKSGPVVWEI